MSDQPVLVLHKKSANRPEVKAAVKAVRKSGIDLLVRIPWNKKDKLVMVEDLLARGHRRLIAGGGDGTLNATANALLNSEHHGEDVVMGIMPLGTANDMARGLELPCEDLEQCLLIACTREARPMDVGVMNGHYFVNVASGGFGAEVTATTPQDLKAQLGGAAYTLAGLVKLWSLEPYTGTLHMPGEDARPGAMLMMAVGNNRYAGGGCDVAPLASTNDGLLDLSVLLAADIGDMPRVLSEIQDPTNPDNRIIRYWQVEKFTMEADQPLHINLDGEPHQVANMEFSICPGALQVVY